MQGDPGYFGPQSMMWKVNKEITVLFGGARALLMHAAHPLIVAGARQTSLSERSVEKVDTNTFITKFCNIWYKVRS